MERIGVKKNNKKKIFKIIVFSILVLFIIIIITIASTIIIRNSIINRQAVENMNLDQKFTTIFCSGENITLNEEVYNSIKDNEVDVIITNSNYKARLDNSTISKNIDIDIDLSKGDYDNSYNISLNTTEIEELNINVSELSTDYLSEFSSNEFITNKLPVLNDGFTKLELNNSNNYTLAYIVPDNFEIDDVTMYKGEEIEVDIGIEPKYYTYGSVKIGCSDQEAVSIDYMRVKAYKIGEYFLFAKTENVYNESSLKILQAIEKIELSQNSLDIIIGNKAKVDAKVYPDNVENKELIWESSDENVATADSEGNISAVSQGECEIKVYSKEVPSVFTVLNIKVQKSNIEQINGITYVNGIMLVNKTYSIPSDYAPGLVPEAYSAFLNLKEAASNNGFDIELISGFRSYETQTGLYNNYVATYGQAEADTFSARPGTSEHQTGLAMDVGWIDDSYGDTPSGIWLANNCYKYGFIIRYPKGKESITGYKYEPWHIRYLGVDIAKEVYESGLCLEEYLGVN